jgi:hypothetical protein
MAIRMVGGRCSVRSADASQTPGKSIVALPVGHFQHEMTPEMTLASSFWSGKRNSLNNWAVDTFGGVAGSAARCGVGPSPPHRNSGRLQVVADGFAPRMPVRRSI